MSSHPPARFQSPDSAPPAAWTGLPERLPEDNYSLGSRTAAPERLLATLGVCRPRLRLACGVAASVALHAMLFFGDTWFGPRRSPPRPRASAETTIQFEMPVIEPEPPAPVEQVHEEPAPGELAPPALPDVPSSVPIDAFVQLIRPAIPSTMGRGLSTIPAGPPGPGVGHGLGLVFDIGSVDEAPRSRRRADPVYPAELRRTNESGEVEVEFVIDAHGEVRAISVLRSSDPGFDACVITAVRSWTFRPGRKQGREVDTRVRQVITFNPSSS